ncbi:MAG: ribosomal subunit interface protein [Alphaproteobacteria bacterium CG_4_9_14_3_um_filter_47_13]|nr:MAG: ribosomal subunit interface protein [Alphaproteobacteria bacterium CG_4_9_14_3_um_filter_47_13]
MELTVQGKQMDVGDALRTYVSEKLEEINQKYFNHAAFATVTFSKEGHGHGVINTHIQIRVGKDIMVLADSQAGDSYGSFDTAAEKIAKQLRRYKKRLRDHRDRLEQTPESEILKARAYTLASEPEKDENEDDGIPHGEDPVIVAEISTNIQTMSVSDAVMRMDLSGQTALLFRNAKHKELNMVYRRPDGNIGWVDPENGQEKISLAKRA